MVLLSVLAVMGAISRVCCQQGWHGDIPLHPALQPLLLLLPCVEHVTSGCCSTALPTLSCAVSLSKVKQCEGAVAGTDCYRCHAPQQPFHVLTQLR